MDYKEAKKVIEAFMPSLKAQKVIFDEDVRIMI